MKNDDRALAEFRGFEHIAKAHIEQLQDAKIVEQIETILVNIETALQKQKKVVSSE
jgi:hypothetical protein